MPKEENSSDRFTDPMVSRTTQANLPKLGRKLARQRFAPRKSYSRHSRS